MTLIRRQEKRPTMPYTSATLVPSSTHDCDLGISLVYCHYQVTFSTNLWLQVWFVFYTLLKQQKFNIYCHFWIHTDESFHWPCRVEPLDKLRRDRGGINKCLCSHFIIWIYLCGLANSERPDPLCVLAKSRHLWYPTKSPPPTPPVMISEWSLSSDQHPVFMTLIGLHCDQPPPFMGWLWSSL